MAMAMTAASPPTPGCFPMESYDSLSFSLTELELFMAATDATPVESAPSPVTTPITIPATTTAVTTPVTIPMVHTVTTPATAPVTVPEMKPATKPVAKPKPKPTQRPVKSVKQVVLSVNETESSGNGNSNASAEDEDEEEGDTTAKRTRRTEIERLSRRRRQATLRGMRDQVKQLENKCATMMASHAQRKQIHDGHGRDQLPMLTDRDFPTAHDVKVTEKVKQLQEKFIELKLHASELEAEQKELHHQVRGKQLVSMSIQSLAMSHVRGWDKVGYDGDDEPLPPPAPPLADLPFHLLPSVAAYKLVVREALEQLTKHDARTSAKPSGGCCMGWRDRRHESDDAVVLAMTKSFDHREMEPIVNKSWDVFSTEAGLREAFGSWGATLQLRVVDRPSPDMIVIHRSNAHPRCSGSRLHAVYLLFRVRRASDQGYTICMRSMPNLETPLEPPHRWTGIFTWLHFRSVPSSTGHLDGSRACQIVYNNYIPLHVWRRPLDKMYIMFLTTVVRWESACVAPRLLF